MMDKDGKTFVMIRHKFQNFSVQDVQVQEDGKGGCILSKNCQVSNAHVVYDPKFWIIVGG